MSVSHHNNTDSSIYTNYCIFFFNLCHCQSKLKSHRQSSLVCLGFSQKRLSNEVFSARSTKSLPTTNDIPSTSNPADELSPSDVVATVTKNAQFTPLLQPCCHHHMLRLKTGLPKHIPSLILMRNAPPPSLHIVVRMCFLCLMINC